MFRASLSAFNRSPLWFRVSSVLLLVLGASLLILSISSDIYASPFVGVLIPTLLVSMGLGVLVFALYFRLAWLTQRARDTAAHSADQRLDSVLQHVLDGILIINDAGICLDANPAACNILAASRQALVGQSIARFYADTDEFDRNWKSFRASRNQRGRTQLRRGDGKIVFVDYAVAADYMPGRHLMVLCDTTEKRAAQERLQEIAENIQEVFWVMDAKSRQPIWIGAKLESALKSVVHFNVGA
jgi:PAS domain S-box-containing protein